MTHSFPTRRSSDLGGDAVDEAAHRLAQRRDPRREQQAGDADRHERRLPADEAEGAAVRIGIVPALDDEAADHQRSEEHTSELQSLMRISYAVFCLKKKKQTHTYKKETTHTN